MDYGASIKLLRKEIGMTQGELAKELSVSCSSVKRWETSRVVPSIGAIQKITALAKREQVSAQCDKLLARSLHTGHQEMLRVPESSLFPVDRESICQLVDESHNAIYVCDMATDELLYANHAAEQLIGKAFVPGMKCYAFAFDRTTPCRNCPKGLMKDGESTDLHMQGPNTGKRLHVRGRRLLWNGRLAHAQYIYEEKTVLEAENGAEKIVDTLDAGVCSFWVYDDGRIQMNYLSDGYFRIMDTTREKRSQYGGFGVANALAGADQQRVNAAAVQAAKEGRSCRIRYHALKDDLTLKELYMRAAFIRREKDRSLFHGIVTDVDCERER